MITVHDKTVLDNIAQRALSSKETIYNSFETAEYCILNNIEGDFVECGVFAGAQIGAMCHALRKHNTSRTIHLFDSFEGIPMAGKHDIEIRGCIGQPTEEGALKTTGVSVCTVEQVKTHLKEWGYPEGWFKYYKGWFQDTVPVHAHSISKIALLRLDGDLYDSTKVCLDNLGHKVVFEGIFIIDDWALDGCRKAVEEYWNGKITEIKPIKNSTPIYWIKR
jgi:hypothetical protein